MEIFNSSTPFSKSQLEYESPSFYFPKSPPTPIEMPSFCKSSRTPIKNILEETIGRSSQARRLKEEINDGLGKLSDRNFIKELKQNAYATMTGKIDDIFDQYSSEVSQQMCKGRNLLAVLEELDAITGFDQTGRLTQVENEYKAILRKLNPPMIEIINHEELLNLKNRIKEFNRNKVIEQCIQSNQHNFSPSKSEHLMKAKEHIKDLENQIDYLKKECSKLRENYNIDIIKQLEEKVDTLNSYVSIDPLITFKEGLVAIKDMEDKALNRINEKLNKSIYGLKHTLKARKDMQEKVMSQIMANSNSDIMKLNAGYLKIIEEYKISEERRIQEMEEVKLDYEVTANSKFENILKEKDILVDSLRHELEEKNQRISEIDSIIREKESAEESIKNLKTKIKDMNDNVLKEYEREKNVMRDELERIIEENKSLKKYRDDFNEAEKDKFNEMEEKHKKDLESIRNIYKEQAEKQQLKTNKLQEELYEEINKIKNECEIRIKEAKELAKNEESSTRAEYLEKVNQFKAQEHTLFVRNINHLLGKLTKDIEIFNTSSSKSRYGENITPEESVSIIKATIESIKKLTKSPVATTPKLTNTILNPIETNTANIKLEPCCNAMNPKELFRITETGKSSLSNCDDENDSRTVKNSECYTEHNDSLESINSEQTSKPKKSLINTEINSDYYSKKQKLKNSIKGIKKRIGNITERVNNSFMSSESSI